jgi:hypothetical protein
MRPVHRADNLTTFMCRLFCYLGTSNSWNPRPVQVCKRIALLVYEAPPEDEQVVLEACEGC